MLLSRSGNHTKYQLWLFRYTAYCFALLSPKMVYEYMWNCSANLQGGIGNNIPCDNLVEILVQTAKINVYAKVANAIYQSVRKAALTTQIQDEIKENIQKECDKNESGKKRPEASKSSDISSIVSQLEHISNNIHGRQYESFSRFKDVFSK